jgi:hypothetical protein
MVYMALDFPATPTDGQEYDNFIYSATKGAWVSKPNLPVKTAIGPVAPSNPNAGDQWLDSNTGTLYVYYTDVDSSQWVEILAKSSVSSALYGRVGVLETEMDTAQADIDSLESTTDSLETAAETVNKSGLVPIIPSSVNNSSGTASINSSGLVTLSNVTSFGLNNVFSSSYKTYRIIFRCTPSTGSPLTIAFRLRNNGTDTTVSQYNNQGYTYTAGSFAAVNNVSLAQLNMIVGNVGIPSMLTMEISNPADAVAKSFLSHSNGHNATGLQTVHSAGHINITSTFDGISFISSVANSMTGEIQVYGYR